MNVKKLAKELEDKLKKNSRKNKDTGNLEKSIKVKVSENPDSINFEITMAEYGLHQKTNFIEKAIEETLTINNITDIILEQLDIEFDAEL